MVKVLKIKAMFEDYGNGVIKNDFLAESIDTIEEAKIYAEKTPEEKERRKDAIADIRKINTAKKVISKYFPNGIKEFDNSVFEQLFSEEDRIETAIHNEINNLKAANENKDKALATDIKNKITLLQKEKSDIKAKIRKATDEYSLYYRAAKPYLDAVKTVAQAENYARYDEIASIRN